MKGYNQISLLKPYIFRSSLVTRSYAAPAVSAKVSSREEKQKRFENEKQTSKESKSFVMNIFKGKIVPDQVFPFPQVLNKEQRENIKQMVDPTEKYFSEVNNAAKNDEMEKVPDNVVNGLAELGAFGLQVPIDLGGVGLNNSQYAKLTQIVGGHDLGIGIFIGAHQSIGFKGILLLGNEAQKKKYLPDLAAGKKLAAFCLTEPSSGSDANSIQSRAVKSADGKHYILNGSKIWISNAGIGDVFTVFAQTPVTGKDGVTKDKVTAFIVERDFGGVTSGPPEKKMGIKCSNTASLFFDNVKIPVENVLGGEGNGFKAAMQILNNGRFGMAAALSGMMKAATAKAVDHATQRKQFGSNISEYGAIQEKLAQMSAKAYVTESMAYMIAGNMDAGCEDYHLEAAISKVYSSEAAWFCADEAIQIHGGAGFMKDVGLERVMRDLRIFRIFEGANDVLRLFVALTGMQYSSGQLKALANPFANPSAMLDFAGKKVKRGLGVSDQSITSHLHPDLHDASKHAVYVTEQFGGAVESLLIKYKKGIIDQQFHLKRVADLAISIYAMTAALSRASMSLSSGLPSAAYEAQLCNLVCNTARLDADTLLRACVNKQDEENYELMKTISKATCEAGGVLFGDPLNL